jgi:hypothetical protein
MMVAHNTKWCSYILNLYYNFNCEKNLILMLKKVPNVSKIDPFNNTIVTGDQLSWLRVFVVFFSPSRQMPG